jgi:hypothetical protein
VTVREDAFDPATRWGVRFDDSWSTSTAGGQAAHPANVGAVRIAEALVELETTRGC